MLLYQRTHPFRDGPFAAVCIKSIDGEQMHVGMFYREEGQPARMLHLAWHLDLRDEGLKESYYWVPPRIPAARTRVIAAICRRIALLKPDLPYGLSNPDVVQMNVETGEIRIPSTATGLTCASFVVAIFTHARLPLFDQTSWITTEMDRRWQEFVCSMLRRKGADEAYVNRVETEIGNPRFRPDEVAAASAIMPPPLTQSEISEPASIVRRSILSAPERAQA